MYRVKVKIWSDSGVGPYTETKVVANCTYKKGEWYDSKGQKLYDRFNTGFDYRFKVLKFKQQKQFIYV